MAYSPVGFINPQYYVDYANWWLKGYQQATTTPLSMATDSSGLTQIVRAEITSAGFIKTSGGALFTPHFNQAYDIWIFPTAAEADANDTTNAIQVADNLWLDESVDNITGDRVRLIDTVALMKAESFDAGITVQTRGYYDVGDGGEATYLTAGPQSVDEFGDHTLANGNVALLQVTGRVSSKLYGVRSDGVTDDTAAIQALLDARLSVEFPPESVTVLDPSVSAIVRQGHQIYGAGQDSTVILLTGVGGSAFRRVDPSVDSNLVRNVIFDGIAVVCTHPATAAPSNYEQIGFDMRSISRAIVRNCYSGNYSRGPLRGVRADPADQQDAIQGYGVVFGTNNTNYSGGEVGTVDNCQIYGAKKCIVVDDSALSPGSASYAASITNNDLQITEQGIGIESQFNAGSVIIGNTIQSVKNARGSTETTSCYRMANRDGYIRGKYIEVTVADCDKILRLDTTAKRNIFELGLIGNDDSFITLIDGASWGNHNQVSYAKPSTNEYVRLDGNINAELGRDKARVLFDGATATIQGTSMAVASVTKQGTGDYSIDFNTNTFADANYTYAFDVQIDGAGSGGYAAVRVQNSTNLRIVTRDAAGAVVDPLRVSVRCG